MKFRGITAALAALAVTAAASAAPFSGSLSKEEAATLRDGKVLIRSVGSVKKLGLKSTPQTEKVIGAMKELNPSYIAEVIQVRPYKGNEDLIDRLDAVLTDIPGYVGIPYWSERVEKWYELYEAAEVTGTIRDGGKTIIAAKLDMRPFGPFSAEMDIERKGGSYLYTMKNLDTLRYRDSFDAVGKECLQSVITVFRDGDNWVLYAVGGADVAWVPFLSGRIETSFINRIKSFCNYVFEKI